MNVLGPLASVLLLHVMHGAIAQPGTLDPTFSDDGIVITSFDGTWEAARAVTVQPDGKIIVAGYVGDNSFLLVRYNGNGTIDSGFGTDGVVSTPIGISMSIKLQPDGKIVVAGYYDNGPDDDFALARYNSDGTLDNTFSTDGMVTTPIGTMGDLGMSLCLQPDGKILLAGYTELPAVSDRDLALVRYNADGTLDNTFGGDGKVTTSMSTGSDLGNAVALQPDGKIVVAGTSDLTLALARYNADGTLDNGFSTDGKVTTIIGTSSVANAVAVQPDGKIIAAGTAATTNNEFALVRYNADGTPDNSFSTDGQVTTSIGTGLDVAYSIALQEDGKIILAGYSAANGGTAPSLARYNADGTLDSGFGTGGTVLTTVGPYTNLLYAMAIQPDEKIITAGFSSNGIDYDLLLVRYLSGLEVGIVDLGGVGSQTLVYPNPISGTARFEYELANAGAVTIQLLDMQGKPLHVFVAKGKRPAGKHAEQLIFPEGISSGAYLLNITAGGGSVSVRIVKQ